MIPQAIQHVMRVLREDLPENLRSIVQVTRNTPGLAHHLPCISVSAEIQLAHSVGMGGMVETKRLTVNGAPVDMGYKTGGGGDCEVKLDLWSLTLAQLEAIRQAVETISWVNRQTEYTEPAGMLNRAVFLRARLSSEASPTLTNLPATALVMKVSANNVTLRSAPQNQAASLGPAIKDDLFELLGRSADAGWVKGRCLEGGTVWIPAGSMALPVPIAVVPEADGTVTTAAAYTPVSAANPAVWRQELHYAVNIEATQEPVESAGEKIEELRLTLQADASAESSTTERMRIYKGGAQEVENFPG